MNEIGVSPTARFVRRIWPQRNELMRRTDWVQAALLLAVLTLSLVLLPVALAAGSETYAAQSRMSAQQTETRHPAIAVLEADAPPDDTSASMGYSTAQAATAPVPARWQVPEGGTRTGKVPAANGLHAGDEVTIWLDQNGNVVAQPLDLGTALAGGITIAALIWLSAVGLLAGAYLGARAVLNRRRSVIWAREWARVEPTWSHLV